MIGFHSKFRLTAQWNASIIRTPRIDAVRALLKQAESSWPRQSYQLANSALHNRN